MRVLEMGSTVAGPFCGRLLADFGAEVIKIEPADGDPVRTMGKHFGGKSLYAASIFRNKQLISVDLHRAEGRDIARAIALSCDVVVENFKPGTLEGWGLGWDDLSRANPRLVMVRISGFGQDGPYASRPGYGVICEAVSGLRHLTGDPDRPPSRVAVSMTDYITGLHAAFGAVMALMARGATGRGQYIDAALYECAFNFMEPWIPAYEKLGHVANRTGSRLAESTPNNLYPTGDGDFIHITAMADSLFRRLAAGHGPARARRGRALLQGAGAQPPQRSPRRHHRAVDGGATAGRDRAQARGGRRAGNPHLYDCRHLQGPALRRAALDRRRSRRATWASVAMAGVVPRLSATPGEIRHAGRAVGEDTRAVLAELLGLGSETIAGLERSGVIACAGTAS